MANENKEDAIEMDGSENIGKNRRQDSIRSTIEKNINEIKNELHFECITQGGWKSALRLFVVLCTVTTPTTIMFGNFLEASRNAGLTASWSFCLYTFGSSIADLLIKYLPRKCSLRGVGIAGAFMFFISEIIMAFSTKAYMWVVCYILQGLGYGFMYSISLKIFNTYFVKARVVVYHVCYFFVATCKVIISSYIYTYLKLEDFKDKVIHMGVINFLTIISMIVIRPIQQNVTERKVEEVDKEVKKIVKEEKQSEKQEKEQDQQDVCEKSQEVIEEEEQERKSEKNKKE